MSDGPLRILALADVSPVVVRGGGERMLRESAWRLAARGHQVRVVSRAPDAGTPRVVQDGGVTVRHFGAGRSTLLGFLRGALLQARRAALAEIEAFRPDVLHVHQPVAGAGVVARAAARGIPTLYTFHSSAPLEYRARRGASARHLGGLAGWAGAAVLGALERACVARAARVHVLSDFSAAQLRALHGVDTSRMVKVPGAADTERFRPADDRAALRTALGWPRDRPVVLTVRNLEARMGLDTLLQAMVRVGAAEPGAVLVVGGEGSLREPLARLAAALGVHDRVRLVGRIAEAALAAHYQAADVFVLPTRALEGFGLVAAEALACGTPVIGTAIGAIPEVLDGLGSEWLVPHDAGALATALTDALQRSRRDPGGWAALRRRCRAHAVTRLSWDATIDGLERELRALAAGAVRAGALA